MSPSQSGRSVFWLRSETLLLEPTSLVLLLSVVFFYSCCYYFSFQAREESKVVFPPPVVKTEVTVIITDVNDEIPTFRSKSYLAEINENAQVNTPVTFLNSAVPEVFDHDQVIIVQTVICFHVFSSSRKFPKYTAIV
jgi:hypothetical protein